MNGKERFIFRALIRWNKKDFVKKSCFSLKFVEQSSVVDITDSSSEFVVPALKLDKAVLDVIPASLHSIHSAQDFLSTLRQVCRSEALRSKRDLLIDCGFQVVKQLNSINQVLKGMYEQHLHHKDPAVAKKAKLKVGQVCEHIVHGYRGVVVGWTIDEVTNKQEVTLLIDSSDYFEFLSLATGDQHKTRRLSLTEARLVVDDDLLRITNSALFSGYFTKFDLNLKRYVPNKELRFCFPLDFPDMNLHKRRGGPHPKLSKEQLDRQRSLKQVRQSLLDLCADLLDIVRLYPIPQSLIDLSLDESREREISEVERAAYPAVAEAIADLKMIEGHLLAAGTVSAAAQIRASVADSLLWGPRVYGAKSGASRSRHFSSEPDLAAQVHEACEMLSVTYKHLEKTLQFRLQQHGIGHLDDLLSVYLPTGGSKRRTIDFESEWALHKERELATRVSEPISSSKGKRTTGRSNFEVLSSGAVDLAITDPTVEPQAHFSVGQVVLHKRFGYRGVIYGYDVRPPQDVSDWPGVKNLVHKDEQPFYWIFPDEGDMERFLGPHQPRPTMYAAQENLQLVAPSSSCPVKNRHIKKYFGHYDTASGEFVLNGSKIRFQFPRAVVAPPVEATNGSTKEASKPNPSNSTRAAELHVSDTVAQNLLLHLLGALKRSFYASRVRSLPALMLPDAFPRLRSITQFNMPHANGSDSEHPVLSLSSLLVLLRTAETSDEAKNIDSLISDIQSAHERGIVCKAMRLANLSIVRSKHTEALALLNKVAMLDPRYGAAHTLLSALHHNRRAYKDSVWWAQLAIKRDPSQHCAFRPLAVSQEQLVGVAGCELDAEMSIRKGLAIHPWQSYMSTVLQSLRRKQFAKQAERAVADSLKAKVKAAVEHASAARSPKSGPDSGDNDPESSGGGESDVGADSNSTSTSPNGETDSK